MIVGGLAELHLPCRLKTFWDGTQETPIIARRFMLGTAFKHWWVHRVHWILMASHHSVGEGSCTIKTPKRKLRKDKNNS